MIKELLSVIFTFCLFILSFSQSLGERQYKDMIYGINFSTASDKEIKKIEGIVETCEKSNYKECVALGYLKIANIYSKNNNIEKSFSYSSKVEKLITEDTDDEIVFYLHALQFGSYMKLGKRMDARKKLDEISVRMKGNPYFDYLLNWYYGDWYYDMGDTKKALLSYKKAYKLAKIFRKDTKKYISKATKSKISNSYTATSSLGRVYLDLGKRDSAKIYIDEALKDAENISEVEHTYYSSLIAARYYLEVNEYEKAQHYLWVCKKIANTYYKSEGYVKAVNTSLLALYEKMKVKDSINYYSIKLLNEEDVNKKHNKNVNDAIDKEKNGKQTLQEDQTSKLKYILILIFLLCAILVYFIFFFYRKYKSKSLDKIDIQIDRPSVSDYHVFNEVTLLAKQNSPEFLTRFNDYNPHFTEKLLNITNLKSSEIRFCAYLYLNFSTKDIAEYTHTSVRTVQTKKYNLRKKLNIPGDVDIYLWFNDLGK
ncbi:hypothetical protein CEY12_10765 [Chryseobacterium sp. T16E-39]|uniref:tetratricopeptide repeat protein n=1 Tax=Chryseobacterium sp. T16E-39 TaxID=2015076 RepID=UPI000B5B3B98|nr:LuxR C-terminal-related transcriptional regulator [Chryseobacterium sp. T16E-39]ASK30560.1 hypothetical protein CEY12_10765 [Chryseobacterium sp. T16E-39]